jgi:transposase-like protein
MDHYSEEFREQILKRMLGPEHATVPQLHRDTGINKNTLYTWRSKWKQEGLLVDQKPKEVRSNKLNPEEKFRIVVETAHLNDAELSAYCRERGLYADQIKQWKQACLQGVEHPRKQQTSTQKAAEITKENKRLQRELKHKEKALTEAAALLVLSKKAQAIWGDEGEE